MMSYVYVETQQMRMFTCVICSFMSMGDGGSDLEEEERPSLVVTPRAGEPVKVGPASYTEEEFFSKSGSAPFGGNELFRMEDNKAAWDASLDADVQATAAVLAEQMRTNPENATDVSNQGGDELAELSDPLGMGVLNQSTMTLEHADQSQMGHTRRQLKKLARWQAENTMKLETASPRVRSSDHGCSTGSSTSRVVMYRAHD